MQSFLLFLREMLKCQSYWKCQWHLSFATFSLSNLHGNTCVCLLFKSVQKGICSTSADVTCTEFTFSLYCSQSSCFVVPSTKCFPPNTIVKTLQKLKIKKNKDICPVHPTNQSSYWWRHLKNVQCKQCITWIFNIAVEKLLCRLRFTGALVY